MSKGKGAASAASASSWDESVDRARLATVKTFEGRMEAARASFEQIPPNGKGAKGRTLAEFADDADLGYDALHTYRQVWSWLVGGKVKNELDLGHLTHIQSYSIAREAMKSGKWTTARQFLQERKKTQLPEGFERWTLDAVRVGLLEKEPTNTGKLQRQAETTGQDVDSAELEQAAVEDAQESIKEEKSEQREERKEEKKREAEAEALPLPMFVPEMVKQMQTWTSALRAHTGEIAELPSDVPYVDTLGDVVQELGVEVEAWLRALGRSKPATQNGNGEIGSGVISGTGKVVA